MAYKQKEIEETEQYRKKREVLDSTLFNWELIEKIQKIEEDDQKYRKAARALDITASEVDSLWEIQLLFDSLNLLRVDTILSNYDFPNKYKVGHDYADIVPLIIHHQSDPIIRKNYLKKIRQFISLEKVEMIERRTNSIMLENGMH